ncbi:hypothetical protein K432DRAFT_352755 [Lepidopterella palustris CBS 459.81]|uniref:F-box domain-containing protein n=1 Tax=Lepidopterella palustris CBS 459.81 TaxID=1314670 RepID=A0A8E2EBK3_9PEZI|nr:hypothetical protein K432DRAFT_352755 [Lepidopterella palustris CBS 459.81]
MPPSLDRLPFDILFCIASSLTFDDVVRLSLTCRQLRLLLNESTLCRRTIEAHIPHSKEAKLAQRQQITYREAVQRIYERREAFAKALPYSARILGEGFAFTYRQGILCFASGKYIRVLDIHSSSSPLRVINLSSVINATAGAGPSGAELKFSLLYYSDDIIAVHCESRSRSGNNWLLAISTKVDVPESQRVVAKVELESSSRLFVRHNASFIYWGTHSGTGTHGHHEWIIQGISIDGKHVIPSDTRPLQLEEFVGSDIGSTVAFEIHEGYFYALSNQTSFDVEEVDWTSFYHCARFPLERPFRNALEVNTRIYRRQHAEGPINDSWTDLSLQVDEATNYLVIVESRREWLDGASKQYRTFYTQNITFPRRESSASTSPDASPSIGPSAAGPLPEDDPLVALLASGNNAHWAPFETRHARYTHPEYGVETDTARSFILARTKFRAYSLSCSSFIDLVEDEKCCAASASPCTGPCLRLRIGSRRLAPLYSDEFLHDSGAGKATGIQEAVSYPPLSGADDRFRYSRIKLWPPAASSCPCAARLHRILNPSQPRESGHGKTLVGVIDERSLIYMVRPGRDEEAVGPIVLVSFDREIGRLAVSNDDDMADSVMGDDVSAGEEELHWRWEPGKSSACSSGACR